MASFNLEPAVYLPLAIKMGVLGISLRPYLKNNWAYQDKILLVGDKKIGGN
jgi:hypothetical protein